MYRRQLVRIKEYSFKTGKGVAADSRGKEIPFTYKQLKNEKAIPVGKKAELGGKVLSPVGALKAGLYYIQETIFNRGK